MSTNSLTYTAVEQLSHLGVITLTGPQSMAYLQGQVTSDVVKQESGTWQWSSHCDPKGKMHAAFRCVKLAADNFYLIMPKSLLEHELTQLKKYAVFHQTTIEIAAIPLVGAPKSALDESLQTEGKSIAQSGDTLALDCQFAHLLINSQLSTNGNGEQFKAGDILQASPYFEAEHIGQFVPQMLNLQAIDGISFEKGCYIGQETVARMHYRGGNKRALYILAGEAQDSAEQLLIQSGESYRRAGSVLASQQIGDTLYLSAVMPNDSDESEHYYLTQGNPPLKMVARPFEM